MCIRDSVEATPPSTPAEVDFSAEVRNKVIAAVRSGRVVEREDVESWLIDARIAANARVVVDKYTRDQAVGIINAVAADGTVDAERKDINCAEGTACDGRRKFIYVAPSAVASEAAVAAAVELRNMRVRVRELERSVSHLSTQIEIGPPVEHALRRVTAAGSAEEKRAVVMAAGSIVRNDIANAQDLRNVTGDRDQKYAADISRNIRPMTQFLADDTPPSLLALLSSLCHLKLSSDDPEFLLPTVRVARNTGQGGSTTRIRTHRSTPQEKALRKKMRKRKRKRQVGRLYMLAQNLIKTVLGRGCRAMHDFHLAQVLKTHGMPVSVIDYMAAHGFCLTESMRYKREQYYVRWRLDKHLMALELTVAAFAEDNCDFRPTTSVYANVFLM